MKDVHVSSETPAYLPVFLYENENLLYNFVKKHAEFLGKISACFLIYITFLFVSVAIKYLFIRQSNKYVF